MNHTVFLSLGTNLGDKDENLHIAQQKIAERVGVLSAVSSVIKTKPWGFESDNDFYNIAIKVQTTLTPFEVLETTQTIEKEMGRNVKSSNGIYHDRIIDIDIILYDNLTIQTRRLTIPHPHYLERDFVRIPLQEII